MTAAGPVSRVLGVIVRPPVRWVGRRVERRLRHAGPDLPEPPAWMVPVAVTIGAVGAVAVELQDDRPDRGARSRSERAEPEATPEAERGTTSDGDDGMAVQEALEVLEVAPPPEPSESDVRAAYRQLTLESHPDQGGEADRFMEVREAWERLEQRQELNAEPNHGEVTQET